MAREAYPPPLTPAPPPLLILLHLLFLLTHKIHFYHRSELRTLARATRAGACRPLCVVLDKEKAEAMGISGSLTASGAAAGSGEVVVKQGPAVLRIGRVSSLEMYACVP